MSFKYRKRSCKGSRATWYHDLQAGLDYRIIASVSPPLYPLRGILTHPEFVSFFLVWTYACDSFDCEGNVKSQSSEACPAIRPVIWERSKESCPVRERRAAQLEIGSGFVVTIPKTIGWLRKIVWLLGLDLPSDCPILGGWPVIGSKWDMRLECFIQDRVI